MLSSPDERVQSIVQLLLMPNSSEVAAWPGLVAAVFYANIYAQETMMQMDAQFNTLFANKVEAMKSDGLIVKQTGTNLYALISLQDPNVQLVATHRYHIQISKSGSLIGDDAVNLSCYGANILCKPGFAYAKKFIQSYLEGLYTDDVLPPTLPSSKEIRAELKAGTISWQDFIMQKKFKKDSTYKYERNESALYSRLRRIHGDDIDADVSVNYVRTKDGNILVSHYQPAIQELDIPFYRKKLAEINKRFLELPDNRFVGSIPLSSASSLSYLNMSSLLNVSTVSQASANSSQQAPVLSLGDLLADR